jgi:intracellular multiplication protein IcmJ
MILHPIQLLATDSNWRLFMLRKHDAAFAYFQERVHKRDHYSCRYCGFTCAEMMEVVNLDGDYHNNSLFNLMTACGFCTQCFFLESIGKADFGGGTFIYLPEISQGQLNALSHMLFTSMAAGNTFAKQARNIYLSLRLRIQIVEEKLGAGLSRPSALGAVLVEANQKTLLALHPDIAGALRILPSFTAFARMIQRQMYSSFDTLLI